jgi:hypothetical protein
VHGKDVRHTRLEDAELELRGSAGEHSASTASVLDLSPGSSSLLASRP